MKIYLPHDDQGSTVESLYIAYSFIVTLVNLDEDAKNSNQTHCSLRERQWRQSDMLYYYVNIIWVNQ